VGVRKIDNDLLGGSLFKKLFFFSVPLILSGVLQLMFNAVDVIVVGRYCGSAALAAVGSTGSLVSLTVNLFMGLSVGTSVAVAQSLGADRANDARETVHTSIAISLICGVVVSFTGILGARGMLGLMGSPKNVIDLSALYLRVYFLGMPASMVFNFGGAIVRATGDTKRPLYILTIAGAVNVVLNLFFVITFKMGVAGVAIATVLSQFVSAALIILLLTKLGDCCRLDLKNMRIYKDKLRFIFKIGIPAGIQSMIFSFSNVLIQSGINSFGSTAMAGNAAAANLDGFIYASMNAVYQGSLAFTGHHVGAKKYHRINKICGYSCLIAVIIGISAGGLMFLFGKPLLGIYSRDGAVIASGMIRLSIVGTTYFLCGIMEVVSGQIRAMGQSLLPMAVSTFGICVLRIIWIYTAFASIHTLQILYLSYPITWIVTDIAHLISFFAVKKRLIKSDSEYVAPAKPEK
jgi:putative MATE family efflux protein